MSKSAAVAIEVHWRVTGSGEAWSSPPKSFPISDEIVIDGLKPSTAYDFEARAVSGCGAKSAWVASSQTTQDVPAGNLTLTQLQANITAASNSAAAANAQLAAIASDNVLSPGEKPTVIRDYDVITTEQAGIDAQATAYGVTTEKSDYDNAISTLTAYLNGLDTPVPWDNKSGNTDIVAATFRGYFNSVYTARQTLLNAIYAAAQSLANAAQGTANTALAVGQNLANSAYLQNPFFTTGDLTGWSSDYGGWVFQSGTNGPATGSTTYAKRTGSSTHPSEALRNSGKIPVYPGAVLKAQCAVKGYNSPNGTCGVRISWRDASDTELSTTSGNTTTGNATNGTYVTGTAPANAMFAHVECAANNHTTGTYSVDNFAAWALADSMDQVPDSATRFAAAQAGADKTASNPQAKAWLTDSSTIVSANDSITRLGGRNFNNIADGTSRFAVTNAAGMNGVSLVDANNRAGIDFSQSLHLGKSLANIPDDATSARYAVRAVDANRRPYIDFTQTNHVGKTIDNIGEGTSYYRMPAGNMSGIGGRALIDFTQGHVNKTLDNVGDGASRYAATQNATDQQTTILQASAAYQPGDNLIPNPNGRLGTLHWPTVFSGNGLSGENAIFGTWDWKGAAGLSDQGLASDHIVLPASTNIVLSVEMDTHGITGGQVKFGVTYINSSGGAISSSEIVAANGSAAFVKSTLAAISPAGTASISVYMRASSLTGTGFPLWRNLKVEVGTSATPFNDWASQDGNELTVAGSGTTVGDQRNLLPVTWASVQSATSNRPLSYSISGTTVTISASATTVQAGSASVGYNASSASVSQAAGTTVTYYAYYLDHNAAGGSQTLHVTSNYNNLVSNDGVVLLGQVQVTVASGGGGSGGTGGGTGGGSTSCVRDTMWLNERLRAADCAVGDTFDCLDLPTDQGKHQRKLFSVDHNVQPCVRLLTDRGAALECSTSTPFDTPDGETLFAPKMLGEQVVTDWGTETVVSVVLIGEWPVAHCHLGGVSYAAGQDPRHRIYSHNVQIK